MFFAAIVYGSWILVLDLVLDDYVDLVIEVDCWLV